MRVENMKKSKNTSQTTIQHFFSSPYATALNFAVAIISLLFAVFSPDHRIQLPAFIVTAFFTIWALYLLRNWLATALSFLSWKFFVGLSIGILVGLMIYGPVFQPVVNWGATLIAPHISFLDSTPGNNEINVGETSGILIRFSESIPWPYYQMINVELTPNAPHIIFWEMNYTWLFIKPTKTFPISENRNSYNISPRFEYNTKYTVKISGPILVKPVEFDFSTEPK